MKTILRGVGVSLLAAISVASAATITYSGAGFAIPDANPTGGSSTITAPIGDAGLITGVSLTLTFSPMHAWAGDLTATLTHGATTAILFQRIGANAPGNVGDNSNLSGTYEFIDGGASFDAAATAANGTNALIANGSYAASSNNFNGTYNLVLLNALFGGLDRAGNWTLQIVDGAERDTGSISGWTLSVTASEQLPAPAEVPEPGSALMAGLGLAAAAWGLGRRR